MGFLDNVVNKSVPQGSSSAKPLMLAFGALLASGALTRKQAPASAPGTSPAAEPQAGGLLGGLGGVLGKLGQGVASGASTHKQAPTSAPRTSPAADPQAGGLLGGLGGLLEKLREGGNDDVAKSWVGSGPNQPISPGQLGSALGPSLIKTLAEKTGLSEQEVTAQLSKILPSFVDKLTPQGRVPTHDEIARFAG